MLRQMIYIYVFRPIYTRLNISICVGYDWYDNLFNKLMKLGLLNIKLKAFAYLGNGETEKDLWFCKSRMEIQTAYIRGLVHLASLLQEVDVNYFTSILRTLILPPSPSNSNFRALRKTQIFWLSDICPKQICPKTIAPKIFVCISFAPQTFAPESFAPQTIAPTLNKVWQKNGFVCKTTTSSRRAFLTSVAKKASGPLCFEAENWLTTLLEPGYIWVFSLLSFL